MGKYLNHDSKGNVLPAKGKVGALIADGATEVSLGQLQDGDVAVVAATHFDAALFVDDAELYYLRICNNDGHDWRPVTYLRYPPAAEIISKHYEE